MDSRRKSVFASHQHDSTLITKKNQHSSIRSSSPVPSSLELDSRNDDLRTLRKLAEKYATNTEHGTVKLDTEVLKAATDLNRALQQTPLVSQPGPTLTGNSTFVPRKSVQSSGKTLPPLPSILDKKLEKAVFTYPGFTNNIEPTYDRLEILGDAYIELIATKCIWNRFQEISSGRISQIRELLVKNETLADYATQYGLDRIAPFPIDYLKHPKRWTKTRGDIFEAYVAAVILSHADGYSVAEQWLSQLWLTKLEAIEKPQSLVPAKEALAKKILIKGVKLSYIDERPPIYTEGGTQTFFIGVYLTGWGWNNKHLGSGQGSNKTIAGNKAAQQALENEDLINAIVTSKISRGLGKS
ncbi:ribonuclease III domain-containing protein [Aspergillus californicus]